MSFQKHSSSAFSLYSTKVDDLEDTVTWINVEPPSKKQLFDLIDLIGPQYESINKYHSDIQFRETLIVSRCQANMPFLNLCANNAELIPIGGVSIDVQLSGPGKRNYLVFVSAQLTFNKQNAGSQITSCVLPNLHTVEEKRVEFIKCEMDFVNEKQLYTVLQPTCYYVISRSRLETTIVKQFYNFDQTENLMLESATIIFMRYLAMIRYKGRFDLSTLYINGDLCLNTYFSYGVESAVINNKKCDVIRIQRVIKEKCGIVHCSITTLFTSGRIIRQEWESTTVILHLNPLIDIKADFPNITKETTAFHSWREDMQLFSRYLDFKTKRLAIYKNYYAEHPEIKSLISDYCQHILTQKPEDILDFTISYFQSFTKQTLPYSTYLTHTKNEY